MDLEIFDESQPTSSVRCLNPKATSFKPRNCRRGDRGDGKMLAPPPGFSNPLAGRLSSDVYSGSPAPTFPSQKHVALDCEMVGVGPGGTKSVLARVSLVDYFGRRIFDTFVKVEERVTDYRHHITGISEKDLSSTNAMKFGQCRNLVIRLIRNKILVGHGLENDLAVLGIRHPWRDIRDTCTYPTYQKKDRFGRYCPSRLCHLAKIHLAIEIQKNDRPHCPMEDACTAMALYRKHQMDWDFQMDCQCRNMGYSF